MTVQDLWESCPSGSRFVLLAYPVLSVVGTVLGGIVPYLQQVVLPRCSALVALPLLGKGFVWALPLSFLHRQLQFGPAVLTVLFEIWMGLSLLPPCERTLGSTTFLCWLAVMSTLVSTIYILMMVLLSPAMPMGLAMPIQGLWPVITVCLSVRTLSKPSETYNFWGVVQIEAKWYPALLVTFFSLMSGRICFDLVAAAGIGYAYDRLKLDRLVVGKWWVAALDRRINGEGFLRGSWIPLGGAPGEAEIESGTGGSSRGGRAGQPAFQAFSGSGQRLGSS